MIVMKFGGTSLSDAGRFMNAADTIRRFSASAPLVVVSAMAGMTDLLDEAAELAAQGRNMLEEIVAPHLNVAQVLEIPLSRFSDLVESLRAVLERIARRRSLDGAAKDEVLAYGELFSSRLLAGCLSRAGLAAESWDAADAGMVTDDRHGRAAPLEESRRRIAEWRAALPEGVLPIVTGFIGRTPSGARTTLGRGGSDLSAAWFAAALGADELQIWTDVAGVMTADPRLVPGAGTIPSLSFDEASEMAFRGAKVLHQDTLRPVREAGIPVRVLNSFDPEGEGTRITEKPAGEGVKCCTHQEDLLLWSFLDLFPERRSRQLLSVLERFDRHGLPVLLSSNSEAGFSIVTPYRVKYSSVLNELTRTVRVSVSTGNAMLSLVGEGCGTDPRYMRAASSLLEDAGIRWKLALTSPAGRSMTFVLRGADLRGALRLLHDAMCCINGGGSGSAS